MSPLVICLLWLWDLGIDGIMCTKQEMENLASVTMHPSLCQQLQGSFRYGKGTHSLWNWFMEAITDVTVQAKMVWYAPWEAAPSSHCADKILACTLPEGRSLPLLGLITSLSFYL